MPKVTVDRCGSRLEVSGKEFKKLNINNITKDGVHYNDVSEIVNLLNDYFSNAANRVLCHLPTTDFNVSPYLSQFVKNHNVIPGQFGIPPITNTEVAQYLKNININKATGLDNISANLLHGIQSVVVEPLGMGDQLFFPLCFI